MAKTPKQTPLNVRVLPGRDRLRYMGPCLAAHNSFNRGRSNAKSATQFVASDSILIKLANFTDLFSRKFRKMLSFATRHSFRADMVGVCASPQYRFWMQPQASPVAACGTATGISVGGIISGIASQEMFRIRAGREIATVKSHERLRVFTRGDEQGHAMRAQLSAGYYEQTIALGVAAALPRPTVVRAADINLGPKSIQIGLRELREWFRIVRSHVISFQIACARAAAVRSTLHGSFYFTVIAR